MRRAIALGFLIASFGLLAACGDRGDPKLLNIRQSQSGPDEFAILPNKPLQTPEDLSALPTPTPGASNRVDVTPQSDAVAVLGGSPSRLVRDGQVSDGALVAHASRFGRDADIRENLAASDLEFRKSNRGRLLERLANVNVYFEAYRQQSLDKHAELERLRRLGVRTPSAPPKPTDD
ncbi:DUF3035 domain-containing protein [Nereida sp. MMG025]|uniref:DUF3035 domain-containing protein n=1 Tax=Nereida sp. MMG025 TaxID=2909981 RepID=UPI001F1D9B78|nr:DUF3035 domain-containing protein [Nereida sp. MMG025]MCF6444849.1 DUF3035 domain-containing protein [Nereida sp. MMG025]